MKRTNFLSAMIISALVVVLVVGCSKSTTSDEETKVAATAAPSTAATESAAPAEETAPAKEPVTLKWFGSQVNKALTENIQKDPVMQEITKKTGVTLDFEPYMSGDLIAKASVAIASGDLPDVFVFGNPELRSKLLTAKTLIPLDDLVKTNAPDLMKNGEYALKLSKLMRSGGEDKLYFIPGGINTSDFDPQYQQNTWNIRWDLYKKLGKPELKTHDQLLKVMKDMQNLEPTNANGKKNYAFGLFFSEGWGSWVIDKAIANNAGMQAVGSYTVYRDVEKDVLLPRLTDPDNVFWKSMKFYNKAYQMGLLDPESATMKFQNLADKGKEGRYFAAPANWLLGGADQNFIATGSPEKGYAPFLVDAKSDYLYLVALSEGGNQFDFSITKANKHPERAMDVINFLASFEGEELIYNGVEGVNWKIENGIPKLTEEAIKGIKSDPDYSEKSGTEKYNNLLVMSALKDPKGYFARFKNIPGTIEQLMTDVQKDFSKEMGIDYPTQFIEKIPHYEVSTSLLQSIQPVPGSDIASSEAKIGTYVENTAAKAIFAKNDADFEKAKLDFIADIKAMGADKVFEYNKTKYEEMKTKVAAMK
ncbi:extracellular solute-binding protein [Paenibacillus psychroresistens]|uniref:extracellular solute-binding protein n=1 Tax=Paenibacillus psychroresistens TaxID=1778678 RepID=UPI0013916B02|nr:extracellular solute-binding protein [Paenibacillus psychroresistens]